MQRAKAPGKHTGRPTLPLPSAKRSRRGLPKSPALSARAVARGVGVTPETVAKVRRAMRQGNQ
jgi:hypothetical protein